IEISPGTMVAVRVHAATPAHIRELEKAKGHVDAVLKREKALAASGKAGRDGLPAFGGAAVKAAAPRGSGPPLAVSRIDTQGLGKPVLDAAFGASNTDLPKYAGVTGPQGFIVLRIEGAKEGKPDAPMLATLPVELGQAWGRAEQEAVLKAM